jgi:flagella basal body P-ring formation protein FlgA
MILVALLAAACLPVPGPNIVAKDIAAGVSGFVPLEPAAVFGYAPMPNVQRIVHPAELHMFLTRQQFSGSMPATDLCFERPTALLTEAAVIKAMQNTLGVATRIEIVELSRFPAPSGELVFPREEIGAPPVALWRGYVRYDGDKTFPVWARVKLTVHTVRMVALEPLRPGVPIRTSQVALQPADDFPGPRATPTSINKIDGALPRRFINADSPLWNDSFDPPNTITKGDRVTVTVRSGLAELKLDAEAQGSGRSGDVVPFKNPESGKLFRARVEGPGQATLNTP